MNVLFCSTATNALGETFSIAVFALELMKKGHNCFFLAPILGKRYLLTFGFDENRILVLPGSIKEDLELLKKNQIQFNNFLKSISPDFVIVADWHEFKPNGNSNNNSYSIHWFDSKILFGTFDHCGFAPKGETIVLYTNGHKTEKHIPETFNLYSFVIRPCPPHDNHLENNKSIYYWSINNQKEYNDTKRKEELRIKLTGSSNKLFLHPIGLWQERAIERIFKRLNIKKNYYSDIFLPIIFNYLTTFDETFTYIIISGNEKEEKQKTYNNINIILKPPLGNSQFLEYLEASDIMITDNLMSSNIGKAIFYNVLPIVFINSVVMGEKRRIKSNFAITDFMKNQMDTLISNNILFPFASFPMGLNEILKMYEGNPFSSCFLKTELFDESLSNNLFDQLFSDDQFKNGIIRNQQKYIEQNKSLPDAESILLQIISNR